MKATIGIKDTTQLLTPQQACEELGIYGQITLTIDGVTYRSRNRIHNSLLEYLAACMETPFDGFLRGGHVINEANEPIGGTQDGRDGMSYRIGNPVRGFKYYSMNSMAVASPATGTKWEGSATVVVEDLSPSPSPSPIEEGPVVLDQIVFGRGYGNTGTLPFQLPYATAEASTESEMAFPYEVVTGTSLQLIWEIGISL